MLHTLVLLRRLSHDPLLTEFTHIILDEVHERDKYSDFLMVRILPDCEFCLTAWLPGCLADWLTG